MRKGRTVRRSRLALAFAVSYKSTGTKLNLPTGSTPYPAAAASSPFTALKHCSRGWKARLPPTIDTIAEYATRNGNLLSRIQHMPPLIDDIWPPKPQAIINIEQSLRDNRPRALVQMATGSGKTLLAIVMSYRLIKFAGAKRILFLVERGNLGKQTLKEFQQYESPYNNYKFHEEYVLQRLTSNTLSTPPQRFASARSSVSIRCSRDRSLTRKLMSAQGPRTGLAL